ncbi:hypothetical protein ACFLU5_03860 [Bacteroidota bacterium]
MNVNDQLEKACRESLNKFAKIDDGQFGDIRAKLEYCLGSYGYDGNPVGLYKSVKDSSRLLKDYKKKNPRKVSMKLIELIEKAALKYEQLQ